MSDDRTAHLEATATVGEDDTYASIILLNLRGVDLESARFMVLRHMCVSTVRGPSFAPTSLCAKALTRDTSAIAGHCGAGELLNIFAPWSGFSP